MKKSYYKAITVLTSLLFVHFLSVAQISRTQILNNASPYVTYTWTANSCNLWNAVTCGSKTVQYASSWVTAGSKTAMPYMWGGWSTQAEHTSAMANCKSAGDVNTATNYGAGLSCASGHDCSGLVSRAWALTSKLGTTTLPTVSTSINYSELQQGDIVNKSGDHTRLIKTYNSNGSATVIESTGAVWKVREYTFNPIQQSGYVAYCYNNVLGGCGIVASVPVNDACPGTALTSSTSCNYLNNQTVNDATASGKPKGSCDAYSNPALADVWYNFVAQSTNHTVTVDPNGSQLDAVIVAYSSCGSNTQLGCSDSPGGNGSLSTLYLTGLTIGNTYYIRVYDYGLQTTNGGFRICVTHTQSCTPVSITSQPSNQTANVGGIASFTVSVSGTPPFSYFWYKNGVFQSNAVNSSSTSNTYNTPTLSANDDGNYYYCLVTNCTNTYQAQSSDADLNMCVPPSTPGTISGSSSACEGSSQTYSINSVNGATSYTWSYSGSGSVNGTGTSVMFSPTSSGTLSVTANNGCGNSNPKTKNITINTTPNVSVSANPQTINSGQSSTLSVTPNNAQSYQWNQGGLSGATPIVSPTVTTTYNVTVTNNGCSGTGSVMVNVNSEPACSTSTASLSSTSANYPANGGSGFLDVIFNPATASCEWSVNQNNCLWLNTIQPTSGQISSGQISYSVPANTATTARTCTLNIIAGSNTYTHIITQAGIGVDCNPPIPAPQVTINGNCNFAAENIIGVSYQWYLDGNLLQGETSRFHTATGNGYYYVIITDASGCTAQSQDNFVDCATATVDEETLQKLIIFPNPNSGTFTISADVNINEPIEIKVLSALGQIVYNRLLLTSNKKLDIELSIQNLSSGIYIIQIINDNKTFYDKLIVK